MLRFISILERMELPEDVLTIVRAFSRPIFKHFKEYNHAMRVMGMKNWKKLKEKLHEEPEHVLPALFIYQDAFVKKKEVYALRDAMTIRYKENQVSDNERWIAENQYYNWVYMAKRTEEELFWLLVRLLYGDGKSYWDVKRDML